MKVSPGDETADLPEPDGSQSGRCNRKAFAKKESGDYTAETDGPDDAVQVEVKALAAKWDVGVRRMDRSLLMIRHPINSKICRCPDSERRSIRRNSASDSPLCCEGGRVQ